MASKSKIKGSTFETKIVEKLTQNFKIKFRRVPLSGSLEYIKGDIWYPDDTKLFPYCIECKHYAELDFNGLLTAKSNDIFSFWKQTLDEAKIMKKKPLLIFRWNRSKDFCAWNDEVELDSQMHIKSFGYNFKIGLLDDWLEKVKINLPTT